jgi:uncharacterized membrane protein
MFWLLIVVIAHLFYSLVFVIDKYIVSKSLPHPIVYTFYVGILSIAVWALIPFGFCLPSAYYVFLSMLAGVAQVGGSIFLYRSLNLGEVSRIIPFIGSFVAIFILALSTFLIGERLNLQQYIAFILLVLGSLVVSYRRKEFFRKPFGSAIIAALFFAVFWVITKYIYSGSSFVSGTVWVRTAVAFVSLFLLLPRKNRELIFKKTDEIKPKTVGFVLWGRILTIGGALCMYFAVFLGSVTLANALQGLQYAFIFLLALLFFRKIPSLKEELSREILAQKIIAIILITLGLFILII